MAILPLPLSPGDQARALLHHILEHGDVVGRDTAGRSIIQLEVDDWTLEKLITFDGESADMEEGGDDEPDADEEGDGPPVLVDLVRPKLITLKEPRRAEPGAPERSRPRLATSATPPLA